jgi:choline dehydrogenase-like flavoprotein
MSEDAEFIVVGSGAGGGTVAARLAEEGFTVLLLEAGGDPRALHGGNPQDPQRNTLPDDYDVPAFHPFATENDALKWDFFVRHFDDDERQRRDPKYVATWQGRAVDGVWYPRAGTLGGCTAHNAMIFLCPHDSDWNELADLTGDSSWRAERMRNYFERIENCGHRPYERFLNSLGRNPSRHGWNGWLQTERAVPDAAIRDRDLRGVIFGAARQALEELATTPADRRSRFESQADPNDYRVVRDAAIGVRYTPLTTRNHQRIGTRERVLDVQRRFPDRLKVRLNALVTRVLFNAERRAVGVEYLEGERLYRAHARPSDRPGVAVQVRASREVILAGGAFNTPQMLMLSGIGPAAVLGQHGIPVVVDLPGVGRGLQDRYEVAVVNRMAFDAWAPLEGATFTSNDAQYREWSATRTGVYTTNGALLSVVLRSGVDRPVPDLFCYALIGEFAGYVPGYSTRLRDNPNSLTWVVLKGHTANTAGEVTLRSADPRDPPGIRFRYFEEGNDAADEDLHAVVQGVRFVRRLTARLKQEGLVAREELPGDACQSQEDLCRYVREHAWGHHAASSCPIGAPDNGGVLSSDFKVHGVDGLRVVDASVFPRVPGLFIVSAVYMIGEKAAEVIAADARRQ